MRPVQPYVAEAPSRAEVQASPGITLLEFGTDWCGHCQAAQTPIAQALESYPQVSHRKIEDGKGRPLGRSFRVTLWPTLILLVDGQEVARLVRPTTHDEVRQALAVLDQT